MIDRWIAWPARCRAWSIRWGWPASRSCCRPTRRTSARCSSSSNPFDKRREPRPATTRQLPNACDGVLQEDPRGGGQRLRRPAGRRPGHRRGLQADGRGPRRPRLPSLARSHRRADRPGNRDPRLRRGVHFVSLEHAAIVRRHRPRQGQVDGRQRQNVFNTLQVYMGSMYVNNFNEFDRSWQVKLQADGQFRRVAAQVGQLKVRNAAGQMVPAEHGGRPTSTAGLWSRATTCTRPPRSTATWHPASVPARGPVPGG